MDTNITGNLGTSCCDIDTDLPSSAIIAPTIFSVALILSVLLLDATRHTWRVLIALVVPLLLIATLAAKELVDDFGPDPLVARTAEMTCRDDAGLKVCVWPENAYQLARAMPVVTRTVDKLVGAGLTRPETVTEAAGSRNWIFDSDASRPADLRFNLALGVLGQLPPRCYSNGQRWLGGRVYPMVIGWLAETAGVPDPLVRSQLSGSEYRRLADVMRQPGSVQRKWIRHNIRAVQHCDVAPRAGLP